MRKKILLLFPNTGNEGVLPFAIAILSSIAKKIGFAVDYFETSFYKKPISAGEEREQTGEFKLVNRKKAIRLRPYKFLTKDFYKKLNQFRPDILAVSANSLEYELFCQMLSGFQQVKSKPLVVVGGVHATVAPEEVIANPHVDALCIGEGEEAWEEFLIRFKKDQEISKIKNFWVKSKRGVIKNPLRPLLTEEQLWSTPLDYSFFKKKHLLRPFDGKMYRRGRVELSRGCPYNCTYCVNSAFKDIYKGLGKFFRVRPFDNLKEAVKRLLDFGVDIMEFQDENFLASPMAVLEKFCRWYGEEVKLPITVQGRPELVNEEKVKLLAKMSCPVQLSLGVESGSERILKKICNRHTNIKQIKDAFRIIKKYKIRSTAYTMIGFPTETRKEVFETINLIRECAVDISVMSVFFPFKGTPLREYCLKKGYITGKEKTRTFTDKSILKNQPMSAEEVGNLRRCYALYTRLPKKYFSQIKLCERDYKHHKDLFKKLVFLVNKKYYNAWNLK